MQFKEYQSKPIVRLAYQISEGDKVIPLSDGMFYLRGCEYKFHSPVTPEVGGWVVFLDESDVYYCSNEVFRDRNIVPD